MKLLKRIGIAILSLIALAVVFSFFLPSKVHVERSIVIGSSPEVVFEQINILKNWEKWSPWHQIDTAMKLQYEGPESGTGAIYKWESTHPNVGNGSLTISASVPFDSIISIMDFMENGKATGSYKFEKVENGTKVIWGMDSDMGMNPIGKYFGLMMDKMVGADFERGLTNLKTICESMPETSNQLKIEATTIQAQPYLSIKAKTTPAEIPNVLGQLYGEIQAAAAKQNLTVTGQPFAIYYSFSPESVELEAGIPVSSIGKSEGNIIASEIKAGNVVLAHHYGPYEATEASHGSIDKYVTENKKTVIGAPWEVYVTDPSTEPDQSKWYTQIYYPVQ